MTNYWCRPLVKLKLRKENDPNKLREKKRKKRECMEVWRNGISFYPVLLPPRNNTEQFSGEPQRAHEESLKWFSAGLNFYKATGLRQMIWQSSSLLAEVLECMCSGWVQGTPVAELFTILLLNTGRLYQVKCFTHLKLASLIELSLIWGALEEIWLCEFSWYKNHV